jgi:hypothetical protein
MPHIVDRVEKVQRPGSYNSNIASIDDVMAGRTSLAVILFSPIACRRLV